MVDITKVLCSVYLNGELLINHQLGGHRRPLVVLFPNSPSRPSWVSKGNGGKILDRAVTSCWGFAEGYFTVPPSKGQIKQPEDLAVREIQNQRRTLITFASNVERFKKKGFLWVCIFEKKKIVDATKTVKFSTSMHKGWSLRDLDIVSCIQNKLRRGKSKVNGLNGCK